MFFRISSLFFCIPETFQTMTENKVKTNKKRWSFSCGICIFAILGKTKWYNRVVEFGFFSYGGISVCILNLLVCSLNFIVSILNFLVLILISKAGPTVWWYSLKKPNYSLSLPKFWDQEMELLRWDVRKDDLVVHHKSKLSVRSTEHKTRVLSKR